MTCISQENAGPAAARQCGEDALYAHQMGQARRELWEACKYRPGRLSNWVYFAASFMPRILLKATRALKRGCRAPRYVR